MKIAVSATAPDLDAEVDPRFGRCQYFIIVDPQSMEFEALDNANAMASGGAGISSAQMIAGKGVEAVLTGNCGPNAYQTLSEAEIQIITGVSGSIKDAIKAYKVGKLQPDAQPSVGSNHGIGMGCGMGRGMGMRPAIRPQTEPPIVNTGQEIEMLKSQAQIMSEQLNEIQRRLEELEKGK
jgi:predicted Fe-Mo cluster-binding NifX family protein